MASVIRFYKKGEQEFLQLATVWLKCRAKVMGRRVYNDGIPCCLENDLLGCIDYAYEMKLVIREWHEEFGGGKNGDIYKKRS